MSVAEGFDRQFRLDYLSTGLARPKSVMAIAVSRVRNARPRHRTGHSDGSPAEYITLPDTVIAPIETVAKTWLAVLI